MIFIIQISYLKKGLTFYRVILKKQLLFISYDKLEMQLFISEVQCPKEKYVFFR